MNAQLLRLEEANARLLELEKENERLLGLQQANETHKNLLHASREPEEMSMEVIEESPSPLHWSLENSCAGVGSDTEPDIASKTDKPNGTMIDTLLTDQTPEDIDNGSVASDVVAASPTIRGQTDTVDDAAPLGVRGLLLKKMRALIGSEAGVHQRTAW